MNKEELKEGIHKELESWHGVEGGIDEDGINEIMLLIDKMDEPEKVVVPSFVGNLIEFNKGRVSLYGILRSELNSSDSKSFEWLKSSTNQEAFARAWLDGYTVEEKEALK